MKLQDSFFFFPRCCSKRGSGVSSRESRPFPALPWAAAAMGGAGCCGRLSSPPAPGASGQADRKGRRCSHQKALPGPRCPPLRPPAPSQKTACSRLPRISPLETRPSRQSENPQQRKLGGRRREARGDGRLAGPGPGPSGPRATSLGFKESRQAGHPGGHLGTVGRAGGPGARCRLGREPLGAHLTSAKTNLSSHESGREGQCHPVPARESAPVTV